MRPGWGGLAACAAVVICSAEAHAATMNYVGTWSGGVSYATGAVVSLGNQLFVALKPNRLSKPSPTNTVWKLIGTNGMDFRGTWLATATYSTGSVVRYGSQTYYSLKPKNRDRNPQSQTAYWALLGTTGNTVRYGSGAPAPTEGVPGDFWIDTTSKQIFGPKIADGWPAIGTSLVGSQGPKGEAGSIGPQGPAGAVGPAGSTGATGARGPTGNAGAQGPTGPQGPSDISLYVTNLFDNPIPVTQGQGTQIGVLGFTPSLTGKALLRARGQCLLNSGVQNAVSISIGTSFLTAFQVPTPSWGRIQTPPSASPAINYELGWTAEVDVNVTAGESVVYIVFARSDVGGMSGSCSGSVTAELFTGTLPVPLIP